MANIAGSLGGDTPACGDAEYLLAFDRVVLPAARAFAPDVVLVSCGFDAAEGDPLGRFKLTPAGYAHLTRRLQVGQWWGAVQATRGAKQLLLSLIDVHYIAPGLC